MIYTYEEVNTENKAIREWNEQLFLANTDKLIYRLQNLPHDCGDWDCTSKFLSANSCRCMRDRFDNEWELQFFKILLDLYLELKISKAIQELGIVIEN